MCYRVAPEVSLSMRRVDESYPVKSTLLYLGVALFIDAVTLVRAATIFIAPVTVLSAGGVLVCIRWGVGGILIAAGLGALVGAFVGVVGKLVLRRYQAAALRVLLASRADLEMGLLLIWAAAAALVFHLADRLMFPTAASVVAASSVLLGRALILPELNDLYWLANRAANEQQETSGALSDVRAA